MEYAPTRQLPRREEVQEVQEKIMRMKILSKLRENKQVCKIHALCKTQRAHNTRGGLKGRDCTHDDLTFHK